MRVCSLVRGGLTRPLPHSQLDSSTRPQAPCVRGPRTTQRTSSVRWWRIGLGEGRLQHALVILGGADVALLDEYHAEAISASYSSKG